MISVDALEKKSFSGTLQASQLRWQAPSPTTVTTIRLGFSDVTTLIYPLSYTTHKGFKYSFKDYRFIRVSSSGVIKGK